MPPSLVCLQVTPRRLQHRRQLWAIKRHRFEKTAEEAKAYNELLSARQKEQRAARAAKIAKKRSESRKVSEKVVDGGAAAK